MKETTGDFGYSADAIIPKDSPEDHNGMSSQKLLHNIKGIIFDFDGTLFDNTRLPLRLIAAFPPDIFRLWKERLIRKRFAGTDFSTTEDYYKAFFKALGKACHRSPERIKNWYFKRYMPRMIHVLEKYYSPRQGVAELFRRLDIPEKASKDTPQKKLRVAVYSDYPSLKERLEALDLYPGKRVLLYGPESFGAQKPATRPFCSIADELGIIPEEVLVVGDREETDGLGAFRSGMRFFCLKTGHKRYFRLDPNRQPPKKEQPHGPSLIMYAGTWEDLIQSLKDKYAPNLAPG